MRRERPIVLRGPIKHTEGEATYLVWWVRCPGCGVEAMIDEDQFHGRVSMECVFCSYHQTHDLSAT